MIKNWFNFYIYYIFLNGVMGLITKKNIILLYNESYCNLFFCLYICKHF